MGRIAVAAGLVAVACGCLVGLALPWAFEQGASLALATMMPEANDVRVQLSDVPVWALATGKLGNVSVEVKQVEAGQIMLDRMVTTFTGVYMSIAAAAQERLVVNWDSEVTVIIEIRERDLEEFLSLTAGLSDPRVVLHAEECVITAAVDLGSDLVQASVRGQFVSLDDRYVGFMVEQLTLDGIELGTELTSKVMVLLGGSEPWFDLGLLPVPLTVDSISIEQGLLRIEASGHAR